MPTKLRYLIWHLSITVDFFVRAWLIKLFTKDQIKLRRRFIENNHRVAKQYLKAFQIKCRIENPDKLELLKDKNYLVVGNHVSYTDIVVLSALSPLVFITSVEMSNAPFLGTVTRLGGSLFTDRKRFVSLPKEIERFSETAKEGFSIVLFPEGTSTDGTNLRPFRSSLFEIALKADLDILPICINYVKINGEPRSEANRDLICWYGDMTFAPHFWSLLGVPIEAVVTILEPITCSTRTKRQELSDRAYGLLSECYHRES